MIALALLFACRPANDDEVLQAAWETIDTRYALLEARGVDWEAQRPTSTSGDLHADLRQMLEPLADNHIQLLSPDHDAWTPGVLEDADRFDFHVDVVRELLDDPQQPHRRVLTGFADDQTAYVWLGVIDRSSVRAAVEFVDGLQVDRLVLDVRENFGGYTHHFLPLASRLVSDERVFARVRRKEGPEPDAFSPWLEHTVTPGEQRFAGTTTVLTSVWTISGGENLVLALGDDVSRVGQPTSGAFGARVFADLPNGWVLGLTIEDLRDAEGVSYEGIGLAPDVSVAGSREALLAGEDPMLASALSGAW